MVKESDNETEILLGNKQLVGIFFVMAVLLGVAFTGGYMVGHGSTKKTVASTPAAAETAASAPASSPHTGGGETHSVGADETGGDQTQQPADSSAEPAKPAAEADTTHTANTTASNSRSRKTLEPPSASEDTAPAPTETADRFTPQTGQTFLQVAAVGRNEAEEIADVLHKKGFRAHAVPKPGNPKIYRVLIGPVRDAGDLSATRDSLRHTGFGDVIVQRY